MAIEKTVWEMTEAEIDALERKSMRMQIEGGDPEFVEMIRADIKKWREDREEARGQVIEWLKKRGDVAELEDERSSDMVRACLSLIRSHVEGKDDQFEETALAIAKGLGGSRESFVQGLFGKTDVLVPQEPVLWTVNVHYADNEVDRVSFQRVDNGWPTKEAALDEFVKSWPLLKEIKLDNEPKEEKA